MYTLDEILKHANCTFEQLPEATQTFVKQKQIKIKSLQSLLNSSKIKNKPGGVENINSQIEEINELINEKVIATLPEKPADPPAPPADPPTPPKTDPPAPPVPPVKKRSLLSIVRKQSNRAQNE